MGDKLCTEYINIVAWVNFYKKMYFKVCYILNGGKPTRCDN